MDPHLLVHVIEKPLPAGVMRCPVVGCQCMATWGANPTRDPRVAEALRREVFKQLAIGGLMN